MKNTFWSEASRGGAILGVASVAFSLIGMYMPQSISFVVSVLNFVVTLYLLFFFTKRRADSFVSEGYSYTNCLGFIMSMGIFAGIILGAYQIVASNFLFPEKYEELYNTMIATYAQLGTFDNNMMDVLKDTMHSYLFNPLPILASQVLSAVLSYGFYGLFISIGTKREVDIFDNTTSEDEE